MYRIKRREAVQTLLADRGDLVAVAGLGACAVDMAAAGDHELNFPLWGAMGGAAMLGLGLALAQPERNIVVITGDGEQPTFVAFCAPEQMTEGTWNLYLIAVYADLQSKGYGRKIMTYLENLLARQGARVLLVETSGLPEFERTRSFYHQCDYTEEARIRDFYKAGEDKVVFWKSL